MKNRFHRDYKVGILGGGQLGKMLCEAASPWYLNTWILDKQKDFPAADIASTFVEGDFKDFDDVYNFGKQMDVLTIEIESVNAEALLKLEKEGIKVHPKPTSLQIIKDKGLQKQFYTRHDLPTSPFQLYADEQAIRAAVESGKLSLPFVQKARTDGYDGRGVAVIHTEADLQEKLLPGASLVEKLVDIEKELSMVVARNEAGEIKAYPAVEMEFNPEANLVEYLFCPASVDPAVEIAARELAADVIEKLDICGLLAVELFLTKEHKLLVNEVAPRPHNSGHHTIDSCYTSQFEQHLRAILNLPLGSTKMKMPSVMVNILGEPGYTGPAIYDGMEEILGMEGVKPHLYGKTITKPYRKMGHVTIMADKLEDAISTAHKVKNTLKVIA